MDWVFHPVPPVATVLVEFVSNTMIYRFRLCLLALMAVSMVTASATLAELPEYDLEFSLNGGYTGNLIKDSSNREESYSTPGVSLNVFPISALQVSLKSEYTYYSKLYSFSNFLLSGGVTLIPTPESSRLKVYLTGNTAKRRYREQNLDVSSTDVNSTDYNALVSIGYQLNPAIRFRSGLSFQSIDYSGPEIPDKNTYELFAGTNLTLFDDNAVDLEVGYSFGKYSYLDGVSLGTSFPYVGIDTGAEYRVLTEGDIRSLYISPRISRSLGHRTGFSLTYSYRWFIDKDDSAIVYGLSTGVVSPWNSSWEGHALSVSIKTFVVPNMILTLGGAYLDKSYLRTLDSPRIPNLSTFYTFERHDYQRRIFLGIRFPMGSRLGRVIEPSVRIDYTSNSSAIVVYDYTDFSISTGLRYKF